MAQDFLKLYGPIKLARATADCWKCKKQTQVAALIASDLEDVEDGKGQGKFGGTAYVYEVPEEGLPGVLKHPLQQLASQYKPIYSRTTRLTQWPMPACTAACCKARSSCTRSQTDRSLPGLRTLPVTCRTSTRGTWA